MPTPARSDSPLATPPSNPPPVLQQNFTTSRGPSPLTLSTTEAVPLAVAFQASVQEVFSRRKIIFLDVRRLFTQHSEELMRPGVW